MLTPLDRGKSRAYFSARALRTLRTSLLTCNPDVVRRRTTFQQRNVTVEGVVVHRRRWDHTMVKKKIARDSIKTVTEEAAHWFVLLKDLRGLSLQMARLFLWWLLRSYRHGYELLRMWRQDVILTRVMRAQRRAAKLIHVRRWQGSSAKAAPAQRRRESLGWHGVAIVGLMLVAFVSFEGSNNLRLPGPPDRPSSTMGTPDDPVIIAAKERAQRELADGSRVSLDPGSTLRVAFTGARRDVHLDGGAAFKIAADSKRPFGVKTEWIEITPHDKSEFAVAINSNIEVEVFEGIVDISERGANAQAPVIRLKRGETYRVPVDRFREIVADGHGRLWLRIEG